MGVATGDFDGDGDLDLFRTAFGPDALLFNESDPESLRFAPRASPEGAADGGWDRGWGASATACDYDGDGWLDLFVTRYMDYDPGFACFAADGRRDYCAPTDIAGARDLLYRNLGDGRFEETGRRAGIASLAARGLGVVCHDFDRDGRLDFFVANDTEANHLWINTGDGAFREEALLRGAALSGFGRPEAGMGVELGDVDRDGDLDLLLTHFADETNTLYLAERGGFFADGSHARGARVRRAGEHRVRRRARRFRPRRPARRDRRQRAGRAPAGTRPRPALLLRLRRAGSPAARRRRRVRGRHDGGPRRSRAPTG